MTTSAHRAAPSTTYRLGVDLGTTYTAAAVAREGRYRVVRLGQRRPDIPSTVCIAADDTVLVGELAEAVGHERPTAVARQCKRRLGDSVPLIIEGRPFSPQALMAHMLRWTVDTVSKAQGGPPELLTVTCPANWGPYKHELLTQVIRLADVPSAIICTEPEAAAFHYADDAALSEGAQIAVYDFGGGTFDAAVLRVSASGFFMLAGPPEGIEHLGGEDFDEAVFSRVLQVIGSQAADLAASNDPATMAAVAELRRQCVVAKELLSTEPAASVDVSLPGLEVTIRVTRQEFEWMIRPALTDTVRAFSRALRNAKVSSDDLAAVVLVGGSVRIPLVTDTLTRSVNCPVVVPVDPLHSVALGAAIAAARYRIPRSNAAQARIRSLITKSSAETSSSVTRPQREATIAARELLKLGRGEQARLSGWLVQPGSSVAVGQPLGRVAVTGGGGSRTALLRSPFEGAVHRYFAEPGAVILRDHLLVSYRQVAAYLIRPGRALPTDTGVLVKINPPTTTTAFTGRPVIFVDRVPRTLWWSGALIILTGPGRHLVSAAYTRANQWFGFASQEVNVPDGSVLEMEYTEPGVGARAVLASRPVPAPGNRPAMADVAATAPEH